MSTKVFTGTISSSLFDWLSFYSKTQKRTRRDIMEEAIIAYQKKVKKDKLVRGFKKMAKDKQILEMVEWGMDDYSKLIQ